MCYYTLSIDGGARLEHIDAEDVARAVTYEALSNGGACSTVRACRTGAKAHTLDLHYTGPGGDYLAAVTSLSAKSPIVRFLARYLSDANADQGY